MSRGRGRESLGTMLRAFRYRNYRLFFAGQGVSVIGSWMQQVAMSWYVYRITNAAFYLGLIGFLNQIPTLLISPFAGVMADRADRRKLLVIIQSLACLQSLLLAGLVFSGSASIAGVAILSAFMGIINSLDVPIRQSFIHEMIDRREDLGNAIALNSAMFNSARLIGPAIAGAVIVALGEGACFLINAFSFLAVIAALAAMRLRKKPETLETTPVLARLREGVSYAWGSQPIVAVISMIAFISLAGLSYAVLMPVIARDVLGGDAHTLGFLMGGAGVGALCGALFLASRTAIDGLWKMMAWSSTVIGVSLLGLSLSRSFWISLPILACIGAGMILIIGSGNTIIQSLVDDAMRGRVMSLFALSFMGMTPLGSILAGSASQYFGPQRTLVGASLLCLAGSAVFLYRLPRVRLSAKLEPAPDIDEMP